MKPAETKFICDLISITADAIATDTIPEAIEYLTEHYQCIDNPVLEHVYNVLSNKQTKQYEEIYSFNQ